MALTCNIDSRGKVARLIYGVLLLMAALVLVIWWARGSGSTLRWCIVGACVAMGAFAILEARAGWCAIRAMGFKTKM